MRLIFLGPPGAGKGTQAGDYAEENSVPHISTGDILRRAIALATPTGVEAKGYVDRGDLVPFEVILRLVRDRLDEPDAAGGWILDGFPRNLEQAAAFADLLNEMGATIDRVVYFEVAEEAVVERLGGRRTCRNCGAVSHVVFAPTKTEGVCDVCGGELYQRSDDEEDQIRNRMKVYSDETSPLVGHYKEQGLLLTIDAAAPVATVSESLRAALKA
ncbi:MAG: adenylate kinase [Planctomycetota bacterium]